MQCFFIAKHNASLTQNLIDNRIGVLEKLSGNGSDFLFEITVKADAVNHRYAFAFGQFKIINAVSGSGMNDTRTIVSADKFCCDDTKTITIRHFEVVKQARITRSHQLFTFNGSDNFMGLLAK